MAPHPHEEEKDKAQGKESGNVGVGDVKDLCMGSFSLNLERYADGFDVAVACTQSSFEIIWEVGLENITSNFRFYHVIVTK